MEVINHVAIHIYCTLTQRILMLDYVASVKHDSYNFNDNFIAQKISSEQSSKVQLQLVLYNGSHVTFQFLGETNVKDRNKVS